MTIVRVAVETGREIPDELRLVRCRVCGHVLAIRTVSGRRLKVLTHCEIDERGRPDVNCPICGTRRRLARVDDNAGDAAY